MASSNKSESSHTLSSERTISHGQKTKIHRDPFDDLLADPEPSAPLFVSNIPSDRPLKYPFNEAMPVSPGSDFGAFISGTSASGTMDHPLIDFNSESESRPIPHSSSNADFFDKFMDGAKERTGESERRILGEIFYHESKVADSNKETSSDLEAALSDALNSSPSPDLGRKGDGSLDASPLADSPPPVTQHTPSSSPSSSLTASLPRKWMPNLLSHNTLPASKSSRADTLSSSRKTILPSLSHSSPFASHIFVPSTGAPGFAGDHHWNKSGFEFMEEDKLVGQLELTGRKASTTVVLTKVLANQLRNSLPALSRLAKSWTLLYSLDQHGVSLQTLYSRCQSAKVSGTLLALRDSEDHVFGVWLGEILHISPGAYYGSGESFLWRSCDTSASPNIYKWSGKNEYVALCESKFISFGGGDGKYGLYLEDNLTDGSSASCPTFDNAVLCSLDGEDTCQTVCFECVGLEVWGISN